MFSINENFSNLIVKFSLHHDEGILDWGRFSLKLITNVEISC